MKVITVKLDKIQTIGTDRFTVTFSVQFEDDDGKPYFSGTTVGVPYSSDLTHAELIGKALHKLHACFRATGAVTRDGIVELLANSIDNRRY